MGYEYHWKATFLNSAVSPVMVRDEPLHGISAQLASKIAWAIGTTLELPYKKNSIIRDDCKFLAAFIVDNFNW